MLVTLMQSGKSAGMQMLDDVLMDLVQRGVISPKDAYVKATEKAKYIEAFFRNVDWQAVERRLNEPAAVRPAAAA